ncbi:MAG: hypothetical protein ABIG90_03535 [bacterium]
MKSPEELTPEQLNQELIKAQAVDDHNLKQGVKGMIYCCIKYFIPFIFVIFALLIIYFLWLLYKEKNINIIYDILKIAFGGLVGFLLKIAFEKNNHI